jgi:hypothetical protein
LSQSWVGFLTLEQHLLRVSLLSHQQASSALSVLFSLSSSVICRLDVFEKVIMRVVDWLHRQQANYLLVMDETPGSYRVELAESAVMFSTVSLEACRAACDGEQGVHLAREMILG